jgi:uncharacterized membrane protein
MKIKEGPNRIGLIDEIRGLAILGMLAVHGCFYYEMIFGSQLGFTEDPIFRFVAIAGGGLFIFISGVSCSFAKSNVRRGLVCLGFGLAISLGTLILWKGLNQPSTFIFFGILHLLGVSMILFGLTEKIVKKTEPWAGMAVSGGLFALSYLMVYRDLWESPLLLFGPMRKLFQWNFLYFFGYPNWSYFPPVDFYPLLPWTLLFFAGGFAGILVVKHWPPKWITQTHSRFLVFCGQHTLFIYLVHPIILYPVILAVYILVK